MNLLVLILPIFWFQQDVQNELVHADGHFNYERFWNPDARLKVDGYHVWCWNNAVLKFSDEDISLMLEGYLPERRPVDAEDHAMCSIAQGASSSDTAT